MHSEDGGPESKKLIDFILKLSKTTVGIQTMTTMTDQDNDHHSMSDHENNGIT